MNKNVLFLTLRVFSATGGIEKVCRIFGKALCDIATAVKGMQVKVFSLYDTSAEVDTNYIPVNSFIGFGKARLKFVFTTLRKASSADTVIVSHINLLSVGYLVKTIFPKKKLLLFAHGIEVWQPLSATRKKMLRKCDTILAVSQFTKNKLVEMCGIQDSRITVFNNCLDPYLPAPHPGKDTRFMEKYGLQKTNPLLFTLTRMSSKELYKGYDHVLYSLSNLKAKFPGIKYMIAGKYDETEKKRLDTLIGKTSIKDDVIFTGYVPDEDLASLFSLADVYVMPSKKEGFGIVFIEAMYYGIPVIAGNKDGSADALNNGKLGMLVDCDNQGDIENAIEKVIQNRDFYKPDRVLLNQLFSFESYKEKCTSILALN
jgi:phosphatidyl-myo-inositol dimannoside synthase